MTASPRSRRPDAPDARQALAAAALWRAGFDTQDVAELLGLAEPVVARLLAAVRDIAAGRVAAGGAGERAGGEAGR